MSIKPIDEAPAHRFFAPTCFNATWDLIDKQDRTQEENLVMLDLAHASLWHWRRREDCTPIKLSIGYWLLSRAYALAGHADLSRRYGALSLNQTQEEDVFYRSFAHEALARAEMAAGNRTAMRENLEQAIKLCEKIPKPEDVDWLKKNLASISLPE